MLIDDQYVLFCSIFVYLLICHIDPLYARTTNASSHGHPRFPFALLCIANRIL